MKRCTILALALVLGCTVLTGCRRANDMMETAPDPTQAMTEAPTVRPTEPVVRPTEPMVTTAPNNSGDVTDPTNQEATNDGMTDSTEETGPRVPQPNNQ